jgi:hypothetical protein
VATKNLALGSNPLRKSEAVVRGMLRGERPQPQESSPPRKASPVHASRGLLRKTIYFDDEEWQAIRSRCYQDDLSYTEVVRAAVRAYLQL